MSDSLGFTPRQIVGELDKFIVGQAEAKRAVALALRSRARRKRVASPLREEIMPKNIIMIGPTGVGKTEIARRLAKLANAPFIKVEASKFTEVGYVGKDVESIIRDLVEIAINLIRVEEFAKVGEKAERLAENRLIESLMNARWTIPALAKQDIPSNDQLREQVRAGQFDDAVIEIDVIERKAPFPIIEVGIGGSGGGDIEGGIKDALSQLFPQQIKHRKLSVRDARPILLQEESNKLIDVDRIKADALARVESEGIVFIDEIDKIASSANRTGADVSREGVQRDLLPIVEGSTVNTKHGQVKTDYILFIASGAFHLSKPSDLIPELQGRFPVRVSLHSLKAEDFVRILTEPENALTKQYSALLNVEGVEVEFSSDGVHEIAKLAAEVNTRTEDIGARRLHTMLEKLLDQVSFEADEIAPVKISVTGDYVRQKLSDVVADTDLSRYIL